jgi:exonuclease VII small subunit
MSNAQESIVRDLEARQVELQTAIQNVVRGGGGSMQLRNELKSVQDQLQSARDDVASAQARGRHVAARASAQAGAALTGAAMSRITGASATFGEILAAGVPAIDFSGSAAIESAMQNVAAARQRVTNAEAEHEASTREVDELAGKATAKRARHAELVQQRVDTGSESGAAELYALSEDTRSLDAMLLTAKTTADALLPPVNAARIELKNAESSAAKVEYRLQAEHLAAHARALDAALIECLRAAQAAGMKAGVGIGAIFQASLDMRTFVSTGVIPQPFRR